MLDILKAKFGHFDQAKRVEKSQQVEKISGLDISTALDMTKA